MRDALKAGWDFTSKQFGSELGAQVGKVYIENVESAIEKFAKDMEKLGTNNLGEKQLKGFVAEYWHADTFNIAAALRGSSSKASVEGSTEHASVDISTNFGKNYSSKYLKTYDASVKAQAKNVIEAYHKYLANSRQGAGMTFEEYLEKYGYAQNASIKKLIEDYKAFIKESGNDCTVTLEQYIRIHAGEYDISSLLMSVYNGQGRLIPAEQLKEAIQYLKNQIAKEQGKDAANRVAVLENYLKTLEDLVDRISDGNGTESIPLTKEQAEAIAILIKEGKFKPEDFGFNLNELVTIEYILNQALKAGYTSAVLTLVLQLGPEIIKTLLFLVENNEIDVQQFKKIGITAISASAEGFLRGSVSSALTIACKAGKLGDAFVNVNPHIIGALTVVVIDIAKSSMLVAIGKMSSREMGTIITKELIVSSVALAGGAIGQSVTPELPVVGYMLGSFIGSGISSIVLNVGEKCLLSFCVDTGFTCFGLVEQDYKLPEDVLRKMGISVTSIQKTFIERTKIKRTQIRRTEINRTKVPRVQVVMVKRGIIGINKIGYI